jgi:hypothetical protein
MESVRLLSTISVASCLLGCALAGHENETPVQSNVRSVSPQGVADYYVSVSVHSKSDEDRVVGLLRRYNFGGWVESDGWFFDVNVLRRDVGPLESALKKLKPPIWYRINWRISPPRGFLP